MWRYLAHPNILPFLGATVTPPQLISNCMPGGELQEYIRSNPNADRLRLVGVPPVVLSHTYSRYQLFGVANGLHYIHSRNVIHGGIKGVRNRSKPHLTTALTPG